MCVCVCVCVCVAGTVYQALFSSYRFLVCVELSMLVIANNECIRLDGIR